ncbi:MAG: homocitrate synthase [Dehalococcoidia bacterium]|nr:homocitrate synthase [Dehalococcoidia bacterium]
MYDLERLKQQPNYRQGKWWMSPLNLEPEVSAPFKGRSIILHDVTLRDGEQTVGVAFSPDERVEIALALDELRMPRIEVGLPAVSEEVRDGMRRIVARGMDATLYGFARTMRSDVDMVVDCGLGHIVLQHIMNPYACEGAYGLDRTKVKDRVVSGIAYAKEQGLKVVFLGWDLTRGDDWDFVEDVYATVYRDARPDGLVVVDTFGVANPRAVSFIFRKLAALLPDVPLEFHTHNDMCMANAGIIEAVAAGCSVVHTAFNGLGDRTGNAATEEVAVMLELGHGVSTGLRFDGIMNVSLMVENISRRAVPPNKPIVGRGLFDLETGIDADLHRKLEGASFDITMQAFHPSLVGQEPVKLVLGKNSGTATVEFFLEKFGLRADAEQLRAITDRVKRQGRIQHSLLTDSQFLSICREVLGR